jgi:hypothetical protein
MERLKFEEDDFPEEQPDLSSQLPWGDLDQMVQTLQKIRSLRYSFGKRVDGFRTLCYTKSILSRIQVKPEKPRVVFTNLVVSQGDTMQISQKVRGYLQESRNPFFPEDEPIVYRITGNEKITVGAGTFECTVVEGIDGFTKVKYWMIRDLPGVYAKSIKEIGSSDDVNYRVLELEKINFR